MPGTSTARCPTHRPVCRRRRRVQTESGVGCAAAQTVPHANCRRTPTRLTPAVCPARGPTPRRGAKGTNTRWSPSTLAQTHTAAGWLAAFAASSTAARCGWGRRASPSWQPATGAIFPAVAAKWTTNTKCTSRPRTSTPTSPTAGTAWQTQCGGRPCHQPAVSTPQARRRRPLQAAPRSATP